MRITALVPALNEAETIRGVISELINHSRIQEVIVVDHNSVDDTGMIAMDAGAIVVKCINPGLGCAMKAGIEASSNDLILRTDADIANWDKLWIDKLIPKNNHSLSRAIYSSPYNVLPISNYVVEPLLRIFFPEYSGTPIPTTGTYVFNKTLYDWEKMPNDWAIDVAILLTSLQSKLVAIENHNIGILSDKKRPVSHYIPMATDIQRYMYNLISTRNS